MALVSLNMQAYGSSWAQRRSLLALRLVRGNCMQAFKPRETPWRLLRPSSSYGLLQCYVLLLDLEDVGDALRDDEGGLFSDEAQHGHNVASCEAPPTAKSAASLSSAAKCNAA